MQSFFLLEDIKNWYDNLADTYEQLYGEEQEKKVDKIINIMKNLFKNSKFENGLDFGCGTGISTKIIYNFSNNLYLYDISSRMMKKALEKYPNAKVINNIYDYKKYFDLITCITVLQDNEDPKIVLEELNSLLSDNGILVLSVLARGKDLSYWKPLIKEYFHILWFDIVENDYLFILSKKA